MFRQCSPARNKGKEIEKEEMAEGVQVRQLVKNLDKEAEKSSRESEKDKERDASSGKHSRQGSRSRNMTLPLPFSSSSSSKNLPSSSQLNQTSSISTSTGTNSSTSASLVPASSSSHPRRSSLNSSTSSVSTFSAGVAQAATNQPKSFQRSTANSVTNFHSRPSSSLSTSSPLISPVTPTVTPPLPTSHSVSSRLSGQMSNPPSLPRALSSQARPVSALSSGSSSFLGNSNQLSNNTVTVTAAVTKPTAPTKSSPGLSKYFKDLNEPPITPVKPPEPALSGSASLPGRFVRRLSHTLRTKNLSDNIRPSVAQNQIFASYPKDERETKAPSEKDKSKEGKERDRDKDKDKEKEKEKKKSKKKNDTDNYYIYYDLSPPSSSSLTPPSAAGNNRSSSPSASRSSPSASPGVSANSSQLSDSEDLNGQIHVVYYPKTSNNLFGQFSNHKTPSQPQAASSLTTAPAAGQSSHNYLVELEPIDSLPSSPAVTPVTTPADPFNSTPLMKHMNNETNIHFDSQENGVNSRVKKFVNSRSSIIILSHPLAHPPSPPASAPSPLPAPLTPLSPSPPLLANCKHHLPSPSLPSLAGSQTPTTPRALKPLISLTTIESSSSATDSDTERKSATPVIKKRISLALNQNENTSSQPPAITPRRSGAVAAAAGSIIDKITSSSTSTSNSTSSSSNSSSTSTSTSSSKSPNLFGRSISNLYVKPKKERRKVLMLGLNGAGKTALLYKWRLGVQGKEALIWHIKRIPPSPFHMESIRLNLNLSEYTADSSFDLIDINDSSDVIIQSDVNADQPRSYIANKDKDKDKEKKKSKVRTVDLNIWDLPGNEESRSQWPYFYAQTSATIFVIDSTDVDRLDLVKVELNRIKNSPLKERKVLILANKQDLSKALDPTDMIKRLDLEEEWSDLTWMMMSCNSWEDPPAHTGLAWIALD